MLHFGDIQTINGADVPHVDCVIGGSPCQDLSIANSNRAGLAGARSGLFMEQIRVIKEMREYDRATGNIGSTVRPRFMVWENVFDAFSSHKGEDFRIVLEETAKIADETAVIPRPPKGKWTNAGCIMGDGWSIAWRVFNVQFWGVPQRRRRIALVADFGGECAPEILFERESVSGNPKTDGETRQGTATDFERDADSPVGKYAVKENTDNCCAFKSGQDSSACITGETPTNKEQTTIFCIVGNIIGRQPENGGNGQGFSEEVAYTLTSTDRHAVLCDNIEESCVYPSVTGTLCASGAGTSRPAGQGNETEFCIVQTVNYPADETGEKKESYKVKNLTSRETQTNRIYNPSGVFPTLCAHNSGMNREAVICMAHSMPHAEICEELSPTLTCHHEQPFITGIDCRNGTENEEVIGTLQAHGGNNGYSLNSTHPVRIGRIIRRLTPLECERLQGFPDGWTDIGTWTDEKGKVHQSSDNARYKALGNSIALPSWTWVLKRLCSYYDRTPTMASLFDGISGFCLIWERLNGHGSVKWTSEIEAFPIAICKRHFGDEKTGEQGDLTEKFPIAVPEKEI